MACMASAFVPFEWHVWLQLLFREQPIDGIKQALEREALFMVLFHCLTNFRNECAADINFFNFRSGGTY